MPDVFDTAGVDLDQYLGTRNSTTGVVVQDKDLITRIKAILGPFVLRRLKSDVMRQLVPKIQQVCFYLQVVVFLLCHKCSVKVIDTSLKPSIQVECVDMLVDQALAYKEAVEEYRALATAARAAKTSKKLSTNILDGLARRQVSNIFTQLRKVSYNVQVGLFLFVKFGPG